MNAASPAASFSPVIDADVLFEAIDALATSRPLATSVIRLSNDPDCGTRDVGVVLAGDQALTAKVLRLSNSAYYGLTRRVTDAITAVSMLGMSTVTAIAAVALARLESAPQGVEKYWHQARLISVAAARLAPTVGVKASEGLACGVLVTVGASVMATLDADYLGATAAMEPEELSAWELERYALTSLTLSAEALAAWDLPDSMVEAVRSLDSAFAPTTALGILMRAAVETARRCQGLKSIDVGKATGGAIGEADITAALEGLAEEAERTW